jgi:ribosomal protein S18 acetylase RimI-like enzyme
MSKVKLEPMSKREYDIWRKNSVSDYAQEKQRSGVWGEDALERAEAQHNELLPQGPETNDHYLFNIVDVQENQIIGSAWLAQGALGQPRHKAWIFDIALAPQFRGKGFGREAMLTLETFAKSLGVTELGLHVFGHNKLAFALYQSLGFEPRSITMSKTLPRGEDQL